MPHLGPLDALRARLSTELAPQNIFHSPTWGNPRVMTEALRGIKHDLGGNDGGAPGEDLLQTTLKRFVETRHVANFTELKYICYGVTVPVGKDQWRVIDKQAMFDDLLALVKDREAQPKQYRRCYQGLLSGYFGFDWYTAAVDESHDNWERLRGYLSDQLKPIVKAAAQRDMTPEWLQTLHAHKNLLTNDPCRRYAKGLKQGDSQELKEVCVGLGITGSSWVWQDALMAYVELVCAGTDASFVKELTGLLDLVNGRSDITFTPSLATKATAMVVIRYCACTSKPEHSALRDTCLHWIGNPWLKRTAWDAHVNNEPARQMVNGWLKRRLIKDFFELLAQDGGADLRRLNYWLKWESQITDMWFVLGPDARDNRSAAFLELRKRMLGRDRALNDTNHQNNAFVMRIGPLLVIEFGVTGNACYAYAAADFRTSLDRKIFTIADLKQKTQATRLSHMSQWEGRFDYELKKLLQSVPLSKSELMTPNLGPSPRIDKLLTGDAGSAFLPKNEGRKSEVPVRSMDTLQAAQNPKDDSKHFDGRDTNLRPLSETEFNHICHMCEVRGIEWEDNRSKGGALWLLVPKREKLRSEFLSLLEKYKFQYAEGKGFWRKGGV